LELGNWEIAYRASKYLLISERRSSLVSISQSQATRGNQILKSWAKANKIYKSKKSSILH